tara:strand:+ start:250 stop:426 length:177 start_codon:yes stop_codon:yes gene_type:complete
MAIAGKKTQADKFSTKKETSLTESSLQCCEKFPLSKQSTKAEGKISQSFTSSKVFFAE